MSARQLAEWEEFAALEPFGPAREDLRAGVIASAAVSPWCEKGRTPEPAEWFGRRKVTGDPEAEQRRLIDSFRSLAGHMGGTVG